MHIVDASLDSNFITVDDASSSTFQLNAWLDSLELGDSASSVVTIVDGVIEVARCESHRLIPTLIM